VACPRFLQYEAAESVATPYRWDAISSWGYPKQYVAITHAVYAWVERERCGNNTIINNQYNNNIILLSIIILLKILPTSSSHTWHLLRRSRLYYCFPKTQLVYWPLRRTGEWTLHVLCFNGLVLCQNHLKIFSLQFCGRTGFAAFAE